MLSGKLKKNEDMRILSQFFSYDKNPEDLEKIQKEVFEKKGIIPSQSKLSYLTQFYNYLMGGDDTNTGHLKTILMETNNVMQTYIVATTVPNEYYNHPLANLAKMQTDLNDFNMYYEMLMLTCALDQIRVEYETLLYNIAQFEHRDAIKKIQTGKGLTLDIKWLNSLKINAMYDMIEYLGKKGRPGADNTLQNETEWRTMKKATMGLLITAGVITTVVATGYASAAAASFFGFETTIGYALPTTTPPFPALPSGQYGIFGINTTAINAAFQAVFEGFKGYPTLAAGGSLTAGAVAWEGGLGAKQMTEGLLKTNTLIEKYSEASKNFQEKTQRSKERVSVRVLKLVTKMQILSTVLQKFD